MHAIIDHILSSGDQEQIEICRLTLLALYDGFAEKHPDNLLPVSETTVAAGVVPHFVKVKIVKKT
jgi:hypothetical protein